MTRAKPGRPARSSRTGPSLVGEDAVMNDPVLRKYGRRTLQKEIHTFRLLLLSEAGRLPNSMETGHY